MAQLYNLEEYEQEQDFTGVVPIYKPAGRARGRYVASYSKRTVSDYMLQHLRISRTGIRKLESGVDSKRGFLDPRLSPEKSSSLCKDRKSVV